MICPTCVTPLLAHPRMCPGCGHLLPEGREHEERLGVLICMDNPDVRFFVRERAVIGRSSQGTGPVDIDLKGVPGGQYISRRHAEIYREGETFWVRDLKSTNGTFVDGEGPITHPHPLKDGVRIRFASVTFEFHIHEERSWMCGCV